MRKQSQTGDLVVMNINTVAFAARDFSARPGVSDAHIPQWIYKEGSNERHRIYVHGHLYESFAQYERSANLLRFVFHVVEDFAHDERSQTSRAQIGKRAAFDQVGIHGGRLVDDPNRQIAMGNFGLVDERTGLFVVTMIEDICSRFVASQ